MEDIKKNVIIYNVIGDRIQARRTRITIKD